MTDDPTPITREDWMAAAERAAAKAAKLPDPAPFDIQDELEQDRQRHAALWPRQVPKRFEAAHVDQLSGDLAEVAGEWDGESNVLLLGGVGTGKTHAAVAMARVRYEDGCGVMFAPAVELLDDLRPNGPEGTMDRACEVDVLVLDDLGSERPTDWTGERLYRLVNRRWLEERPTLVTANLSAEALEAAVGGRMFSRLWHGALAVEVAGEDRRRAA